MDNPVTVFVVTFAAIFITIMAHYIQKDVRAIVVRLGAPDE